MGQEKAYRKIFLSIIVSILILCFFYRFIFLFHKNLASLYSFSYIYSSLSLGFIDDIVLSVFLSLICFGIFCLFSRTHHLFFTLLGQFCISVLLLCLAIAFINHKELASILHLGFDVDVFIKSIKDGFGWKYSLAYLTWKDGVLILLSLVIFPILLRLSEKKLAYTAVSILIVFVINILVGSSILLKINNKAYWLLKYNPVVYSTVLFIVKHNHEHIYAKRLDKSNQNPHSIKLTDKNFINYSTTIPPIQRKLLLQTPWNVVIFVLESTGSEYIFSKTNDKIVMPYLYELAKKGWWLENHYTTGNNSALAEFSLLTGIYPSFQPSRFEQLPHMNIPSMRQWLGKEYDTFLVSPTSSEFYAAKGLRRQGFKEVIDSDVFDPGGLPYSNSKASNEMVGFDIFLSRLNSAKSPFLGLYWSSAAHHPYVDYGPRFRISSDIKNDKDRYLNNLFLLDQEIKQLFTTLKQKNLLDKTIVIIIGDHGESFGNHNSWLHGFDVYKESINVPVLFYQPAIFKPLRIKRLTSTIDIAPTLLDAMGIVYNPQLFQGESLFRPHPLRKYIFVSGAENNITTAIDQKGRKLFINFNEDECRIFDLKNDPFEKNVLSCRDDAQEKAAIMFRNYQLKLLSWYNQEIKGTKI